MAGVHRLELAGGADRARQTGPVTADRRGGAARLGDVEGDDIDDLTAAWRQRHGTRPAPSGFPHIATKTPDAANGQKLFQQRCAFCHGAEGEGRYASGTYYRPALWGPSSFDAEAGMARPATFAAFVHANMPYGSGGALTEQEAWDLAGFVDRQCRPKKPGCPG